MNDQDATKQLTAAVAVTREDIARAKTYVLASGAGKTDELADRWLQEQNLRRLAKLDCSFATLGGWCSSTRRGTSLA